MPEEAIETQDLKEKLEEAAEERASRGWILWLSLSTAIVAVLAAIASLQSGSYANEAIVQKNDAVLHQSKADDAWAYYQAKGVKASIYAMQADPRWQAAAEKEKAEQKEVQAQAQEEEKKVAERDEQSEHSLHVHHTFAKSVTLFQVAIALAAIAALTRRKPMWWVSLGLGAAGAALFAMGLFPG
jgi:cell division protein FtsN